MKRRRLERPSKAVVVGPLDRYLFVAPPPATSSASSSKSSPPPPPLSSVVEVAQRPTFEAATATAAAITAEEGEPKKGQEGRSSPIVNNVATAATVTTGNSVLVEDCRSRNDGGGDLPSNRRDGDESDHNRRDLRSADLLLLPHLFSFLCRFLFLILSSYPLFQ